MATFVGNDVFRFINGTSYETFTKDEDYQAGRITAKVAGKVRIAWNGTDKYEYVEIGRLTRIDRETYVLDAATDTAAVTDNQGDTDNQDTTANTDKAAELPKQRNSRKADKADNKVETL